MVRVNVTRREEGRRIASALHERTTTAAPSARLPAPVCPKIVQSLAQPVVQRDGDDGSVDPATVHRHARAGIRGPDSRLPFLAEIQQAFGRHDVTGVRAHVGGPASVAARGMRARAYAVGERVAFDRAPDLRTAAHEAAHVVQQRAGVQVPDGVGRPGDHHEQHAEYVAGLVADGRDAESAFGPPVAAGSTAPAVQCAGSEQELANANKALRAPDTLNQDTDLTITRQRPAGTKDYDNAQGTRRLANGTRIKIVAGDANITTIEIFEWSSARAGYDRFLGTVPTAAVTLGTIQQTALARNAVIVPASANQIDSRDVYQVGLSDCYFQAALISLADTRPQEILDIIKDRGNDVTVRLYEGDKDDPTQKIITLDRSLFLDNDGNPVYHGKKGAPLWPAFISKAWAVLKGSYAETQMGFADDAMFALTGMPSKLEQLKQPVEARTDHLRAKELYFRVCYNLQESLPIVLSTGSFAKDKFVKAVLNMLKHQQFEHPNLPSGEVRNLHAYAVLDIQPRDKQAGDFQNATPDIDVTLRDPRNKEGATFKRKLHDIIVAGKFQILAYGDE